MPTAKVSTARHSQPGSASTHPPLYYFVAMRAAVLGQLGKREQARNAVQELLTVRADFASMARDSFGKTLDAQLVEHLIDGLRKAGLEIPEPGTAPDASSYRGASSQIFR